MSYPPADHRPAGSQFTLRGMFILITATSVIFAILALVIKTPVHWIGALLVPVICLAIIGLLELGRRLFPPPPREPPYQRYQLPPLQNPLQTTDFRDEDYPYALRAHFSQGEAGQNPFGPPVPPKE